MSDWTDPLLEAATLMGVTADIGPINGSTLLVSHGVALDMNVRICQVRRGDREIEVDYLTPNTRDITVADVLDDLLFRGTEHDLCTDEEPVDREVSDLLDELFDVEERNTLWEASELR